jgi:putative ABC transport system ATP-binding protein/lipoprotein-releasing system ATP-binding protein
MIALNSVSKTYMLKKKTVVPAVDDVSLNVKRGEFVVVTGRSGSGKTTLLNLVAGLARPTAGQVLIDHVNLWSLSDAEQSLLRNRTMGFVFQFSSLLPSLTVLENVMLPTMLRHEAASQTAGPRARNLLDQVGLSDKLSAYPRELSAGQQQRVVIARALINQPSLLLADEPTSNLDEQTEREIMAVIEELHAVTGITVLLVTHAGQLAPRGTRALHMAGGRIVRDESLAEPFAADTTT